MAKSSRSSTLSDEVTWDDVRLAKPGLRLKRVQLAIAAISATLLCVGLLIWNSTTNESRDLKVRRHFNSTIKRPRRVNTLCDTVKGWSAASVLRLGSTTRQACGD